FYVGKQYIDNTGSNDRSLDAYFVNNLRLSYNLPVKGIRGIAFTVLLNNLFNEQYISNAWTYSYYQGDTPATAVRYNDFGFYPQAGTNVLVGITVKL
ncbi:MAG: TonB-dependent receptor, partial [Paludibacter sp.]